jgi:hypothetical protein
MSQILTSDIRADFLKREPSEYPRLDLLVERAEMKWIDLYREVRPEGTGFDDYNLNGEPTHRDIQLRGWREVTQEEINAGTAPDGTEAGDPNINTMNKDLLRRLRTAIAMQVDIWAEEEASDGIKSISQGERSVTYLDPDETDPEAEIATLLRPYDQRDVWY